MASDILSGLALHDLAQFSLVSRGANSCAFPYLHRTVFLTLARDLQLFAERTTSDTDKPSPLALPIRELIIDDNYKKCKGNEDDLIQENDLGHLVAFVSKLIHLERWHWDLIFVPRNPDLISALQTNCPELRLVHWSIVESPDDFEYDSDDFSRLCAFKNLHNFSLTIEYMPNEGLDNEHFKPIVSLIQSSPELQSLVLDIRDWDGMGFTWSPSVLTEELGDYTLPSLRTFRALGSADPNWWALFRSPDSHSLHNFFHRHPQLHTIALGWVYQGAYIGTVDPDFLAKLFPSLKQFEASGFLVGPLLASSLTKQLESLAILDQVYFGVGPNLDMITQSVQPLPNLRKLVLHVCRMDLTEVEPLMRILRVAPVLEELEIRAGLDEPTRTSELLSLVPNLRVLGVPLEVLGLGEEDPSESEITNGITKLAQAHPNLKCVKNIDAGRTTPPYWIVRRVENGELVVTQSNSYAYGK